MSDSPGRREIADMGNQRIEGWSALGPVEPRNGGSVAGIGAEAINGLGRERDQPALRQGTGGGGHGGLAGGHKLCFQAHIHGDCYPQFRFLRYAKPKAISRLLVGVWLSPV